MTDPERRALEEIERLMSVPRTTRDIARRLGISHATVQNIEARAVAKMRRLVHEDWRESKSNTGLPAPSAGGR